MKKYVVFILILAMLTAVLMPVSAIKKDYGLENFIGAMPIYESDGWFSWIILDNYKTCDGIQENIVENIDNYFLPSAYDISPFSAIYERGIEPETFYDDSVVYDEKGKISIPPMYTAVVTNKFFVYNGGVFEAYAVYKAANKNNMEMTDTMWRSLNAKSIATAINAFIAPWTLYNDGVLYAWPELMAMSEDEINALDFESHEFYTFISGVKEALETRGWWKDEYQEKYDVLNSHRNDYPDTQPENETLTVDGKKIYLARMNEEYSSSKEKNLNNIISVNIYDAEFKEAFGKLDESVKEKYSELVGAIQEEYDYDYYQASIDRNKRSYKDTSFTEYAPGGIACENALLQLWYLLDVDDSEMQYEHMMLFAVIEKCNVSKDEVREACERYNYIKGNLGAFNEETIDIIVNSSKKEAVDYFKYETSVVVSYDPIIIMPWSRVRDRGHYGEITDFDHDEYRTDLCDDYVRFVKDLERIYEYGTDEEKVKIRYYIDAVKRIYNVPQTGDNSVLYVIIAAASLTAMSAMVFRRKRKVTE